MFTKKVKSIHIFIFGILIISILFWGRIFEQSMPIILLDEFGFWSNAAYFAGKDWSAISSHNSYYSYGYSILLAPILKIGGTEVYKAALLLNYAMIVIMLLIYYKIIRIIFPNLSSNIAAIISLIVVLYPSNAGNLHIAWDELFLAVAFDIDVIFLLLYLKGKKQIFILLWVAFSFFTYIIHQRALGVLIATFITFFFMVYRKKINPFNVVAIMIMATLMFIAHRNIKNNLLDNVLIQSKNMMSSVNDYPSIYNHLVENFNYEGLLKLIISIGGKIAYIIFASCGSFVFALKKYNGINKIEGELKIFRYYLILVFILELGIASVFTMGADRLDSVVYGRYSEWFIQIYMLIGMAKLIIANNRKSFFKCAFSVFLSGLLVSTLYNYLDVKDEFIFICAQALFIFYKLCENRVFILISSGILGLIPLLVACLKKNIRIIAFAVMVAILYIASDYVCVNRVLESNYRSEIVKDIAKELDFHSEIPVMYIYDDSQLIWYVADLQVYKSDLIIEELIFVDDTWINEPKYIMVNPYSDAGKSMASYGIEPIISNWQVALYMVG